MITEGSLSTEEFMTLNLSNEPSRSSGVNIYQELDTGTPFRSRWIFLSPSSEDEQSFHSKLRIASPGHLFSNLESIVRFQATTRFTWDIERALHSYKQGLISLGRAAEIARLPYDVMIDELERRGISLHFGPESAEKAEQEERRFYEMAKRSPI